MKVLVTGANGYLGVGIVKAILDNGNEVIAADLNVDRVDKRADKRLCNIFEVKNAYDYFEKPDVLLHLAWRDGFVHYSSTHINDLPLHYAFIKEMADSGCAHISVLGSVHEVGFYEGCVNETTPCHPVTPYGIAKNALRELTELVCSHNKSIFQWLRGYYIVGDSRYGSSVFSKISIADEDGKEEFPFTWGRNQYDFIEYNMFCEQVAAVVEQKEINGIINICSGCPEKLADRVERFIKEKGYKIKLKYGSFPDRPYDSKAIWGDNEKIRIIMENRRRCHARGVL